MQHASSPNQTKLTNLPANLPYCTTRTSHTNRSPHPLTIPSSLDSYKMTGFDMPIAYWSTSEMFGAGNEDEIEGIVIGWLCMICKPILCSGTKNAPVYLGMPLQGENGRWTMDDGWWMMNDGQWVCFQVKELLGDYLLQWVDRTGFSKIKSLVSVSLDCDIAVSISGYLCMYTFLPKILIEYQASVSDLNILTQTNLPTSKIQSNSRTDS